MAELKITKDAGGIEGLILIEPKVFGDHRGYFLETWNERDYKAAGIATHFVQDNESSSTKGVLRGLHFQKQYPQDKLVRAFAGEVFDVAVDLREGSKTFGKHFGAVLSGENKRQMYVPAGFAHGFLVLSESAVFTYKVSDFYHPDDEGGIAYNDPDIGVEWPLPEGIGESDIILSDKDLVNQSFAAYCKERSIAYDKLST